MVRWVNVRRCVLGIALSSMVAGCGATRSSADNPTSFGGLTPNTPDMEAGLVAIAPGFDIRTYKAVVVDTFSVADSEIQDEGDRSFAAKMTQYLHVQLLRRLRESGLFQQVASAADGQAKPAEGATLRLRGVVTRLGRGSQAVRYFAGLYGAGRCLRQGRTGDRRSPGRLVRLAVRRVGRRAPRGVLQRSGPRLRPVPGAALAGSGAQGRAVAARPVYPFTAPAVSPCTMYLCR